MKGIVTEYNDNCLFCGRPTEAQHHLVYGKGARTIAEKHGLKIPCCNNCHNMGAISERIHGNPMAESMSKIIGQLAYEKHMVAAGMSEADARDSFRAEFGVSYI